MLKSVHFEIIFTLILLFKPHLFEKAFFSQLTKKNFRFTASVCFTFLAKITNKLEKSQNLCHSAINFELAAGGKSEPKKQKKKK